MSKNSLISYTAHSVPEYKWKREIASAVLMKKPQRLMLSNALLCLCARLPCRTAEERTTKALGTQKAFESCIRKQIGLLLCEEASEACPEGCFGNDLTSQHHPQCGERRQQMHNYSLIKAATEAEHNGCKVCKVSFVNFDVRCSLKYFNLQVMTLLNHC